MNCSTSSQMTKTKIILDADVIIHFAKGGYLSLLPSIIQGYDHIVLDIVYNELKGPIKHQLDNQINLLKNIALLPFNASGETLREYAELTSKFGKGESASMVYCHHNHDVLASSNLKDINNYCAQHGITYLTTLDFLYYAIKNKVMTRNEAQQFVVAVRNKGSILPAIPIETYVSQVEV